MTMNCRNCGAEPCHPTECRLWMEYRVGGVDSPERFHLCSECKRDPTINPVDVWANDAEVHQVRA